jgi:cytochrome c-type biogenesis protein CcmH
MIAFWAVAGVLSALAAGFILKRAASAGQAADPTVGLYRRQLSEIDDLADRGLLAEPERKSAHAEAARRLLAAAEAPGEAWTGAPPKRTLLAAAALTPVLAAALYLAVGAPGLPDQPFAGRLAAWQAADPSTLGPPQLAALLRAKTRERPADAEAFRFLAIAEGASGDPIAAERALKRAITLAPERADLWEALGVTLVMAGQGAPSPRARAAFDEALKRDPRSVVSRFYRAREEVLTGDRDKGLAAWKALAEELPEGDPRRAEIERARAEILAPQPAPAMPDIRGMVAGLAARLKEQPDDPEGWVRLVRSYAVLGDAAARDAAHSQATARFKDRPEVVRALDAAARAEPMR